jgi:soluble lytic murein transglycosylase
MGGVLTLALALSSAPALALEEAATRALQQGDCRPTLQDQSRDTPAQALARARCQVQAGQIDPALATLTPLTGTSLSGYAALVAAEALVARGEARQAAARLAGVSLSGPAGQRAALVRGRALVESGQHLDGRDALRPLLAGSASKAGRIGAPGGADPAEVRWWLAEGAARRGEPAAAIPVWQALWARNPTSPRAAEAAERLAAAGLPVPNPSTTAGRDLIRVRIQALEKLQGWKEALALRDQMPTGDKARTASALARASFRAKDYPRAVDLFTAMPARSPEQAFDLALGASRTGDYALAARHYQRLIADHPGHALSVFADFKLAYLAYDDGELDRAIPLFEGHLERHPTTRRRDEALWFIGWAQYSLGEHADADATFGRLLRDTPASSLASGARYWQARIAAHRGDTAAAEAGYAEVQRRWPLSGHAWFAAWRLDTSFTGQPEIPDPPTPASLDIPEYRDGLALAEVGLGPWARAELDGVSPVDNPARWALARARLKAGDYTGARKLVKCPSVGRVGRLPPDQRAVCLARPMGDIPARQALTGGLPRNLPYAIMTAESALRPEVASPAGARGLMQLMPSLGAQLHPQRYGDSPYHPDLLFQPGYNAALGVDELVSLRKRFADAGVEPALPLVIAGYNAGEDAVRRWLANYETPPEPDRFAEDIGYTETRRYVKRVLGYLQTYRAAYGDG